MRSAGADVRAAATPRAAISHIVFDMDGLLLDTEGLYNVVQEKILARYGKVFDWSIKAKTMGGWCTTLVRLIHHLHANGIPICVATGTHKHHFAVKTQNHQDMFSLMHHVVTGDDPEVKAGKPCPDIFLAAMKRFERNVEPSNCLVFEDAPLGVAAAKTAGMYVVMIPDSRLDVSYHEGADQVLCSLLDFRPSEWGLPPFKD